jgi:prophage regulatory protein
MEHQIQRLTDVIAMTGLSRSTIYLRMVQGKFPKKINLGSRAVGWISSEVNEWIEERIRESRLVEAIN